MREQAIWSLGYRQLRALHPATLWPAEAMQLADEALVKLADAATAAGKVASEQLPLALRHVQWEGASAMFARAPGLWGEALECFASPALARVLLVCLEDIPPQHRLRALRLGRGDARRRGGADAARARRRRRAIDEKLEMLFLIVTLARRGASSACSRTRCGACSSRICLRQRAKWHLAQSRRRADGARPARRARRPR